MLKRFFAFECGRNTDAGRLSFIALGAVCIGVVAILFLAPLIVRMQYATLSIGDRVHYASRRLGTVESSDGNVATVKLDGGEIITVPISELDEL